MILEVFLLKTKKKSSSWRNKAWFIYAFEANLPSNFGFSITDNVEEIRVDPAQETGFKKYHELFVKRESQLKNLAKNQRIALFKLSTKDNFYTSLMHYFR